MMSQQKNEETLQAPVSQSKLSLVPLAVPNVGSATGNPRNKCALKPGHSLMDWIRLGNSGVDLSGTGGRITTVTSEELFKHNTRNDAWMAIRGMVYNVTRYMDFHPGGMFNLYVILICIILFLSKGVEDLMRGVGTDATKLFDEVHAWVNYTQLLNKCRIGPLKNVVKRDKNEKVSAIDIFAKPLTPTPHFSIVPRLDWIQKHNQLILYFYTKQFCNPGAVIRNLSDDHNHIEIWILVGLYIHKFKLKFQECIIWPPKSIKVSTETGKIEVVLEKREENLWQDLGKCITTKILASSIENETTFDFKLSYKNKFNKNSYVIQLENENICLHFPVGSHVQIQGILNGTKICKSYTPVPEKYILDMSPNIVKDTNCIHFLIKQYENRDSFSCYLCNSELRTTLNISSAECNLNLLSLAQYRRIYFLAAGSGLTPFLSLIDHLIKRNTNRP